MQRNRRVKTFVQYCTWSVKAVDTASFSRQHKQRGPAQIAPLHVKFARKTSWKTVLTLLLILTAVPGNYGDWLHWPMHFWSGGNTTGATRGLGRDIFYPLYSAGVRGSGVYTGVLGRGNEDNVWSRSLEKVTLLRPTYAVPYSPLCWMSTIQQQNVRFKSLHCTTAVGIVLLWCGHLAAYDIVVAVANSNKAGWDLQPLWLCHTLSEINPPF